MERLRRYIKRHGIQLDVLSNATGLSYTYLQTLLSGDNELTVEAACKLQKAIGISAYNLLCSQIAKQVKNYTIQLQSDNSVKRIGGFCHIKGQVDIRTYNALRRHEMECGFLHTLESLCNREQLQQIKGLGPKSIEYILECPEKYRREECLLAHV